MTELKAQPSSITNCMLFPREGARPIFWVSKEGEYTVQMDRYLICPIEMFTDGQIKRLSEKYFKTRPKLSPEEVAAMTEAALKRHMDDNPL